MDTKEKEKRINFWYHEGLFLFKEWLKTKNETTWGAFCCCAGAIIEYDRNIKKTASKNLQRLAWNFSYLKGEISKKELEESGWLEKKWFEKYKKIAAALV